MKIVLALVVGAAAVFAIGAFLMNSGPKDYYVQRIAGKPIPKRR